jgi:quercetin dioxygenase-like cupin family protein
MGRTNIWGLLVMKPYVDQIVDENTKIRTFLFNSNSEEYQWHRDEGDRKVTILEVSGEWKFQMENSLPVLLKKGDVLNIPNHEYHRLLPSNSFLDRLVVSIVDSNFATIIGR